MLGYVLIRPRRVVKLDYFSRNLSLKIKWCILIPSLCQLHLYVSLLCISLTRYKSFHYLHCKFVKHSSFYDCKRCRLLIWLDNFKFDFVCVGVCGWGVGVGELCWLSFFVVLFDIQKLLSVLSWDGSYYTNSQATLRKKINLIPKLNLVFPLRHQHFLTSLLMVNVLTTLYSWVCSSLSRVIVNPAIANGAPMSGQYFMHFSCEVKKWKTLVKRKHL